MKNTLAPPIYKFTNHQSTPLIFDFITGDKINSRKNDSFLHRQHFNEVLVFYKGGGSHEIDFIKYPIRDQSIHFVTAGQAHLVIPEKDTAWYNLLFSDEFLALNTAKSNFSADLIFFRNGKIHPILNLSAKEFEVFHVIIELLKNEFFDNPGMCGELLRSIFHIFILQAKRLYDNNEPNAGKKQFSLAVSKFLSLIEKDYIKHYTLKHYATMLNVSPKYLSALCKKYLGKNAYTLVEEKLALEAKRLLVLTNKTIKEISFALNFENPSYFTRFFKKETGFTPHEYRKNVL